MPQSKKFLNLLKATKEYYVGKKVKAKYRGKYGKIYDPGEAKAVAYAIAKKLKWKT